MMSNLVDVFDEAGKLASIDLFEDDGTFVISAIWDENDDHTEEKIKAFREWVDSILKSMRESLEY
jgi:hypothetical protein